LEATLKEMLFRFLVGGFVVSVFSALADVLRPRSLAGLFGAAPSVALATLGLTIAGNGVVYASLEARSMIGGAVALFVYTYLATWMMFRYKPSALLVTAGLLAVWLSSAFAVWSLVLK
jgi:Protein of unknown function (DUF3147)